MLFHSWDGSNHVDKENQLTILGPLLGFRTLVDISWTKSSVPMLIFLKSVGGSTYWWLSRGNTVTTLETDPEWSDKILKECEQFLERLTIHKVKTSEVLHAAQSMNALFDVVVNDGHGDRLVLGRALKQLLKPSGILVWDNSDREDVSEILKALHLPSESRLDFFGLGPINGYCWQTTLISLDGFKSEGRTPTFQNIIY